MDQSAVRDLEQIQEQDEATRMPRALSAALVGLGGAAVAFAILAMGGRKAGTSEKRPDPLGDLVASHGKAAGAPGSGSPGEGDPRDLARGATRAPLAASQLTAKDVTFPSILSDEARPTTALAAVRTGVQSALSATPPPATDKLPVVTFVGGTPPVPHDDTTTPEMRAEAAVDSLAAAGSKAPSLPAQDVLEATPIVTRPRDALTKTASDSAQINAEPAASVPSGHDGGWQLQVSSFKSQAEAEQFADQLRARGHKAYTVEARVVGRGTWWRVRVGPFSSQHAAQAYRSLFEAKEHVVPFVVQPAEKSGDKH
jgi:cell division septation protein DedD